MCFASNLKSSRVFQADMSNECLVRRMIFDDMHFCF